MYADGDIPELLRRAGAADRDRTATMMRRLYPGRGIEECEGSVLSDGVYPPGRDGVCGLLAGCGGRR
ncbi:DUF6928 family protein [Streptomyces sp. NPDC059618]|uniref:DUF6928 family protein n=1 Tax=Streptomyces sp. NPDC059618 TaxID=3346887 RepID=UPI0036BC58DF